MSGTEVTDDQPTLPLGPVRTWGSLKVGDRVRYEGKSWEVIDLGVGYKHCDRCDLIGIPLRELADRSHHTFFHVHANEEA